MYRYGGILCCMVVLFLIGGAVGLQYKRLCQQLKFCFVTCQQWACWDLQVTGNTDIAHSSNSCDPKPSNPIQSATVAFYNYIFFREFDIVDRIRENLEKYASSLESVVEQRTAELVEEKRKTDLLLNRMLPSWAPHNQKRAIRKLQPSTRGLLERSTQSQKGSHSAAPNQKRALGVLQSITAGLLIIR